MKEKREMQRGKKLKKNKLKIRKILRFISEKIIHR